MIIYHPYQDINHCIYRLLSILIKMNEPISINKLRILDFYYLFPSQLKNIDKWPRKNSNNYKLVQNKIKDSYEIILNPKKLFFSMKEIQYTAISNLISLEIIKNDMEYIVLQKDFLPNSFIKLYDRDPYNHSSIYNLIINEASKLDISGKNGLKRKSGLMEFQYDN